MNTNTGLLSEPITARTSQIEYSQALGYLRAFVVVLVVLHHAVLAYHPFAPPPSTPWNADPQWWRAFPVVDSQRWTGFALIAGFNDTFFMSLMFFLSGLFVWSGLRRKGPGGFLQKRALRLGIPFMLAASLVAPLAYYPAYLQRTLHPSFTGWWQEWISLPNWPTGPAWFLAVLLAFDGLAALSFTLYPNWAEAAGRGIACVGRRPLALLAMLVSVSAAVYVPMSLAYNPLAWSAWGPITFQTSRILLYLLYFFSGIAVGAHGLDRGVLAPAGVLAVRYKLWCSLALLSFVAATTAAIASSIPGYSGAIRIVGDWSFALSCAASSLALLSLFLRFVTQQNRWMDSLRDNSYGIYLLHYAFCSWLQYLLLAAPFPAAVKGFSVFAGALALSWWVSSWGNKCASSQTAIQA